MKTLGGLFSGIGGIESGFEKAGFKTLWSNENDPYSVRSFKHNYKHQLYAEDIRKVDFKKLKPVDVLVGGFPCQAFSVAGYQKIANHAWYTFWYVIPTLPMFLAFPFIYKLAGFWPSLLICIAITGLSFVLLTFIVRPFGINLL